MANNSTSSKLICFTLVLLLPMLITQAQHHHITTQQDRHIYLAMMDTMMARMDSVHLTGFVETDFLLQMIRHHEGAIHMSMHEINFGKAPQMIQLAKSILIVQQSEIAQMYLWLSALTETRIVTTAAYSLAMSQNMQVKMDNMLSITSLTDLDNAFARILTPHHQGVVDMARLIIQYSGDS